ncbi:MAG TPA: hypothetical protein VFR24_04875 [Candidatus Angelobacter sp.]|nr:hypothetical protein [Candidatus Angelobacter sp.]
MVATVAAAFAQGGRPMVPKRPDQMQAQPSYPVQQPGTAAVTAQPMNQQQMNQQQRPGVPNPYPQAGQQQPQQTGQQQPATQAAEPPPTTPATPPEVTYRDGMLTVQAANSTLNSVVTAIRNKTGIEFEGWENVPDRVVLSVGPAPAGEVLSAIFSGSRFDFVAVGRPDSPGIVQRVILTPKNQPGAGATTAQQRPVPQNTVQQAEDEDNSTDDQGNGGDPQDVAAQPPAPPQTQAPPENQQQTQQPKTPEQLFQELQEMRKQQEQQQQGITPNPAQVPRKTPPLN